MIKAIFFDIDGTLLSHTTNSVPLSTIKALHALQEKGILLFMATGRHKNEIAQLPVATLPMEGYVTINGQYCYNHHEVIYDHPIVQEDIIALLDYMHHVHFPCLFVEEKDIYINYYNERVVDAQNAIHSPLPPLGDIYLAKDHKVYQLDPFIEEDEEEGLLKQLPHVLATRWHGDAMDLISADGGKHKGILKVLEHYHLTLDEAMAFGDGENDEEMLKCVGTSVAMGNAIEPVKDLCDHVTDDIDHDGIFKALQHYHLL